MNGFLHKRDKRKRKSCCVLYNVIPYDQETEIINLELRIMFMTGRLYIYLYIVMAAVWDIGADI